MSAQANSGQIKTWNKISRKGTIIGCDADIRGVSFSYDDDGADAGLLDFLEQEGSFNRPSVRCNVPGDRHWVKFDIEMKNGVRRATNVSLDK